MWSRSDIDPNGSRVANIGAAAGERAGGLVRLPVGLVERSMVQLLRFARRANNGKVGPGSIALPFRLKGGVFDGVFGIIFRYTSTHWRAGKSLHLRLRRIRMGDDSMRLSQ
jgi:hypothetical protein